MSYSYSELNEIIKLQYAKKTDINEYDNWFLEETIKMGKGYSNPGEYLKNIGNRILEEKRKKDNQNKIIDPPLYLDKSI